MTIIYKSILLPSLLMTMAGCAAGSNPGLIDTLFGAISDTPILSAVPTQTLQQEQLLKVDVNNVKESSTGSDKDMSYACKWSRVTGGPVTTPSDCVDLPNGSSTFEAGSGLLNWTPSTTELGQYKIEITGTNKAGSDSREFVVDVRLKFEGLISLTGVQGDRMTLSWAANAAATGYQILRRGSDGTYSVFKLVTDPTLASITLLDLVPLTTYAFRIVAIDSLGAADGNTVTLSAVTADLVRLEVTAAASELSPGQSTTVTVKLKDNGGNYLATSGLSVGFGLTGAGTGTGTFSATTDLGNGIYTSIFTATSPGTLNPLTASLTQYYYVEQTAAMTVKPLQVEILTSAAKVNPNRSITLTARVRDFTGALVSTGGHALAFNYASGTSTAVITPALDLGTGTYTATFTGGAAGTAVTLGASLSTASTIYSTTTVQVVPYNIEITSALTDVSVTRKTNVTARIKDWQGNFVTAGGQGLTFEILGSAGIVTLGATTDNSNGTYTAQISGLSLGTIVVSASMTPSFVVTQSAAVTVRKLRLEIASSAAHLMPTQTATLTGRVKDWQGNVVGVGSQSLDFSASGGTSSGTIGTVTDLGTGIYTATFTAGGAGTALTVSGSISETYQVDLTAPITVEKWRVYVATATSTISTGQAVNATVTVKDYLDVVSPLGGQTVSISLSGGTSSGSVSAISDNNNGTYSASITGITTGTAMTVTAALTQSYQVIQTATLAVGSIHLAVTVQNAQMNPGGTSFVYAQVKDSAGTNLSGGSYTINFSYGSGTSTGSFSSVSNLGSGLYRATFTGAVGGTAVTITAASATTTYVVDSTQTIQVVPWSLKITAPAVAITVGQSVVLTGRVYDYQNNLIASGGKGFAMSLATSGVGAISAVTDNNNGTYTATFTANDVGTTEVAGTVTTSFVLTSTVTLTTNSLHMAVTVDQAQMNPGGTTYVYAQVKDALGNNLTLGSYSINFSVTGGTSTGTFSTVTNQGGGLYRAQFTGANGGTAVNITATSATTAYAVDSTQSITVVPWSLKITAPSTAITVGQTVVLTGKVYDYLGALVATGGKGFAMNLATSGPGTLNSVADNNDGSYTTTFTAVNAGSTLINGSISSSFVLTSTVTLVTSDLHLAVTVQNPQVNPSGTSFVYVQTKNAAGANVTTGSYSLSFSYSGGTSTGTFSAVTHQGGGLYRATFTGLSGGTAVTVTAASATASFVVDSTQTLTVVPWALKVTSASTAITVGQSTVLTGKVYDYNGTLVATGGKGFAMNLATAGVGSLSAISDNNDGSYTAIFSATGVGSTSVNASVTSSYVLDTTVTLDTTEVHLAVTVANAQMNPGGSSLVYVQTKNAAGVNISGGSYSLTFSNTGGTSTGSFSAVTNLGAGRYSATFTGSTGGTATTVTAASATQAFIVDSTQTITVVPWSLRITAPSSAITLGQSVVLTGKVYDFAGTLVATGGKGFAMNLATSGIGTIGAVTDNADGSYTATFSATGVGSTSVNGSVTTSYTLDSTVTLVATEVHLAVTVASSQMNPGGTTFVYVQTKNAAGTNISGGSYSLSFSYSGGTSTGTFSAVTSQSNGLYRATFTGASGGTPVTITGASATQAFVVDSTATVEVVPWSLKITTSASNVTVGQSVTLTGRVYDYSGTAVATGGKVFAMSLATAGVGTLSAVNDNNDGTYTATFSASTVGSTSIGASISSSYTLTSTVTITTAPVFLAITVANTQMNPGGTSDVFIQTQDGSANPISGGSYSLSFFYSGGTSTGSFGAITSLGAGRYRATFTGSTGGTATTISASSATYAYTVASTQTITVVPWSLKITASATAVTVGQAVTLTGKVYDYTGALVTSGGKGFAMGLATTGVGSLSSVTDNGDGTYAASFSATGVGSTAVTGNITSSYVLTSSVTLVSTAVHLSLSVTQSYLNPSEGVTVTAIVKNAAGVNLMASGYTIGFTYSGGSSTGSLSSTINLGTGAYTTAFTGNIAGTATTITANASVPFVVDQTVDLTVMPWRIYLTSSASSFAINETGLITASVRNWNNVTVTTGGKGISLSLGASGIGSISSTTDNTDGTYAANFQATGVGTVQVLANMSQSFTVNTTLNLTVGKIYLVVTLGPTNLTSASLASGATMVARVTINNSTGTKVTGTGYSINLAASGGSSTVSADTSMSEVSTGVYEITYRGVTSGTALTLTASATVPYISSSTAALSVTPSTTISSTNSTLAVSSTTVRSGSPVTLTATLKDAAGNLVPGLTGVTFAKTTGAGIGAGTFSSVSDGGNGTYTATFTGTSQGANPTTVTVASGGVTVASSVSITVTSGSATSLTLSGPTSGTGGSCTTTPYYLSFYDSAGNATTLATSASFAVANLSYGVLYSDSSCTNAISTVDVSSGASGSNMFYLKTYYPGAYSLNFAASGIVQSNTLTTNIAPVLSWLGAAGTLDAFGSGNSYGVGFFDGSFNQNHGLSVYSDGSNTYLFASDTSNNSVQKLNITNLNSISVVGTLGKVNVPKGVPTGGTNSSYCTGLGGVAANLQGVNGAFCTGGQYNAGTGDAMFSSPYKSTVMTLGGVRYMFQTDSSNNRIVKYKADTGEFVGWTGYSSATTGTCLGGSNGTTAVPATSGAGATAGFCLGGTPAQNPTVYASGLPANGNVFRNPTTIANDGTNLYVYDTNNLRIVMLDPSTGLLVRWMGRISSVAVGGISGANTSANPLNCLSNQSDGSAAADGYFTPSWCTGGYATGTALAQGSSTNIYLNPMWQNVRGIGFYSDGTYNWMAIADQSTSRIERYFCGLATATPNCSSTSTVSITNNATTVVHGPGEFFGWTGYVGGTTTNSGGAIPASINTTGATGFFPNTPSGSTFVATNGWAYYGTSSGQNIQGGTNQPYAIVVSGTVGYTVSQNSHQIQRLNLVTGVFNGWIGRISATPTGGVSGCAGANSGAVTPGWCFGGSSTAGSMSGDFGNPLDLTSDGTYLYVADRDNYRVAIHNQSTGAAVGSIGLRLNSQPTTWSTTAFSAGTVMPTSTGLSSWYTQRDRVFSVPDQAVIAGNYMYVSDTGNARIKRYNWLDGSYAGWIGLTANLSPTGGDPDCIGALVGGFTPGWCQGGGFNNTSAFGFNTPRGLAANSTHLFVADSGNHRIVRIKLTDGSFDGWIGLIGTAPSDGESTCSTAVAGQITPGWCLGGAGAAASSYQQGGYRDPYGLVGFTDTDGRFYLIVADTTNNRLQKIDVLTTATSFIGFTTSATTTCTPSSSNNTSNTITKGWCKTASNVTTTTGTSTGNNDNGSLSAPRGLAIDTSTSPYYVYATNSTGRIQRYNASTGAFAGFIGYNTTVATTPNCLSGTQTAPAVTPSWCTGGVTTAATASTAIGQMGTSLNGLYSDGTHLFVSDTSNSRVQKWNRSTGAFVGWVGRTLVAPSAGGSTCTGLSNGSITPTWCSGGSSKAGYQFDTTNLKTAFDTPTGIVGMGAYIYVIDSVNGRIVSMPKD